jgi:hypothetical protein
MTQHLIRTAKGTFTIHHVSWGWGVLNLNSGHVHGCQSEQECWDWLQSHGPYVPGQPMPRVYNVFPDELDALDDDLDGLSDEEFGDLYEDELADLDDL